MSGARPSACQQIAAWLVLLILPLQGFAGAIARVHLPTHTHRIEASAGLDVGHLQHAQADRHPGHFLLPLVRLSVHADHSTEGHAHSHAAAERHHHELAEPGLVLLDDGEDGTSTTAHSLIDLFDLRAPLRVEFLRLSPGAPIPELNLFCASLRMPVAERPPR